MSEPTAVPLPDKPDGRRVRGDLARRHVLAQAVRIAEAEGLEGLSFGGVAQAAGTPKSTLQMLFKTREILQSRTLEAGAEQFAAGIAARLEPGLEPLPRLKALCAAWFDLLASGDLPGGCLVTAATAEYRGRPGPLQTLVAQHRDRWRATLQGAVEAAQRDGGLRAEIDPGQLVFEIIAFQASANVSAVGAGQQDFARARRSVEALLDRAGAANPGGPSPGAS